MGFLCFISSNKEGEEIELVPVKDASQKKEDDQSNIVLDTTESEVCSSANDLILPIERLAILLLVKQFSIFRYL